MYLSIDYNLTKNTSFGLYAQYRNLQQLIPLIENTLITENHIGNIGLVCRYGIL